MLVVLIAVMKVEQMHANSVLHANSVIKWSKFSFESGANACAELIIFMFNFVSGSDLVLEINFQF